MSAAQDLDPLSEAQRKDRARAFVNHTTEQVEALLVRLAEFESGEPGIWEDAWAFAQRTMHDATTHRLPLLAACADEVMVLAGRGLAMRSRDPDLPLYMRGALDTVALELVRLRHDRSLR